MSAKIIKHLLLISCAVFRAPLPRVRDLLALCECVASIHVRLLHSATLHT